MSALWQRRKAGSKAHEVTAAGRLALYAAERRCDRAQYLVHPVQLPEGIFEAFSDGGRWILYPHEVQENPISSTQRASSRRTSSTSAPSRPLKKLFFTYFTPDSTFPLEKAVDYSACEGCEVFARSGSPSVPPAIGA